MSSHHIVRDEQEPALILHRLVGFDRLHLNGLLEWSPTVVCCEPCLELYLDYGHKVDVAMVSLRQFDAWKARLENQQPLKILTITDQHFLETGVLLLQRDNHKAINVVTDEQSLSEVLDTLSQWQAMVNLVVFTATKKYLFVSGSFKKWVSAETTYEVFCIEEDCNWTTTGFDKNVSDHSASDLELYRSSEGVVEITGDKPFIIAEDL